MNNENPFKAAEEKGENIEIPTIVRDALNKFEKDPDSLSKRECEFLAMYFDGKAKSINEDAIEDLGGENESSEN